MLVARSSVYVGDPVDVLVLTRTFWNGLDYHVSFNDVDEPCRINDSTLPYNDSLPGWVTKGDFVSSVEFENGVQLASVEGLNTVHLTHRYPLAGIYMVKLRVSGHMTLRDPIQRAEVAVNVVVHDWPSLGDIIGRVTLASQSQPAYVNESVAFVYAVENVVENVSYYVQFGTDLEKTASEDFYSAPLFLSIHCICKWCTTNLHRHHRLHLIFFLIIAKYLKVKLKG